MCRQAWSISSEKSIHYQSIIDHRWRHDYTKYGYCQADDLRGNR
jgi:hypothetical protein